MSVPFSNTHLRVPRGFGTILEGLTREILRDQPEDIPIYAAHYFEALLKKREEGGTDPAEWAAKLEDRYYNDHAFKATEVSAKEEPATEETSSKEKSNESQTDSEHSHSAEASDVSTAQPYVSEDADLSESMYKERKHNITEEQVIEKGLSEEESVNRLQAADVQPDDLSGTEEEDPTITEFDQVDRAANGKDSGSASDQDKPQSELEPTDLLSSRGISNVDVCAQELGMAQDEGGDKKESAVVDEEIEDSEGEKNDDNEEAVEIPPYSGLADVDVCATELGGAEVTMKGGSAEDDTQVIEEGTSTPKPEETDVHSSLSQSETLEGNQRQAEDETDTKEEEEGAETEVSYGGIHESLAHVEGGLNSSAIPEEDSLVEISFEDVPEAQQIKEVEEKQPEEEGSVEVLQSTILEMQEEEESEEVTNQNISSTQDQSEPEMMGVEKEVNSEGEEMQSQHEASDKMKEKVDKNDSNVNDSDDDKHEGVKTIGSSHQPTIEADEGNPEDETNHENEDDEKISEGEFHQSEDPEKESKSNDSDFKEDETTDAAGEDKKDIHTKGYSEVEDQESDGGGVEHPSSQVIQSNISTAATEAESETLEASAQHLSGEMEESQRTPVESQLEETVVEKEVTSKERSLEEEELVGEGKIDSDVQEKSDAVCEEGSIGHIQSEDQLAADQQEERQLGPEKDFTEPESKRGDKEECSRPQEEEDIMDIPLDDPEANRAAAKIQAGFRGHMTRKKMKPEDKAEGEERQEDRGQ